MKTAITFAPYARECEGCQRTVPAFAEGRQVVRDGPDRVISPLFNCRRCAKVEYRPIVLIGTITELGAVQRVYVDHVPKNKEHLRDMTLTGQFRANDADVGSRVILQYIGSAAFQVWEATPLPWIVTSQYGEPIAIEPGFEIEFLGEWWRVTSEVANGYFAARDDDGGQIFTFIDRETALRSDLCVVGAES